MKLTIQLLQGDCRDVLATLPEASIDCCVTSPPYWGLRDYGVEGQLGLEPTPAEYVATMVQVFEAVRRVLKPHGTCWVNLGDSYARNGGDTDGMNRALVHLNGQQKRMLRVPGGSQIKPKDLVGIPWMVAFALRNAGWYLRSDIIWAKPNPMPESVSDRPTKAHEYLFLLTKNGGSPLWWRAKDTAEWTQHPDLKETIVDIEGKIVPRWRGFDYFYDAEAIKEPASPDTHARYARGRSDDHKYADGGPGGQTIARSFAHMKKKVPSTDKQRGHSRKHAGFNDRWDGMSKEEQRALGSNKRSVWTVPTFPCKDAHFATFPPDLIRPCIRAGCPAGGVVLDPFGGSGTTGQVALEEGRSAILIELNPEYIALQEKRTLVTPGIPGI